MPVEVGCRDGVEVRPEVKRWWCVADLLWLADGTEVLLSGQEGHHTSTPNDKLSVLGRVRSQRPTKTIAAQVAAALDG